MKHIKWKALVLTALVCLIPILAGIAVWNKLPESIAIHFDIHGNPDNFASKGFAVFALPVTMSFLQIVCCIVNDLNLKKRTYNKKIEILTKWMLPVISIVLQIALIAYALGINMDMRRICAGIVGLIFIVTGRCLSELDYIKNYNISKGKAKKINKFMGTGAFIFGIAMLISIIFPPLVTTACLLLLIPYLILSIIYTIKVSREK